MSDGLGRRFRNPDADEIKVSRLDREQRSPQSQLSKMEKKGKGHKAVHRQSGREVEEMLD